MISVFEIVKNIIIKNQNFDVMRYAEKYKDEYGKIRHVSFDDDEDLINDIGLVHFFEENNNNDNINNDNNKEEIKSNLIDDENEEDEKKKEKEMENDLGIDQKKIMDQINSVLMLFYSKKIEFVNIDIMKIINIMLYYDKEKYSKFCCKEHSDYFNHENKEKKIMEPELFEVIKPLEYILKLFFKKYKDEPMKDTKSGNQNELSKLGNDILSLFEILTMDISPCLQRSIIKIFYEFFEENIDQAFKYVNLFYHHYNYKKGVVGMDEFLGI